MEERIQAALKYINRNQPDYVKELLGLDDEQVEKTMGIDTYNGLVYYLSVNKTKTDVSNIIKTWDAKDIKKEESRFASGFYERENKLNRCRTNLTKTEGQRHEKNLEKINKDTYNKTKDELLKHELNMLVIENCERFTDVQNVMNNIVVKNQNLTFKKNSACEEHDMQLVKELYKK